MKRVIMFFLLMILIMIMPLSFGEETAIEESSSEEYIVVELVDGTVEIRPVSMYQNENVLSLRMAEAISVVDEAIINAKNSPEVLLAAKIQPIYLTAEPTDVNSYDRWRFDFMKMTESWDQIYNIPYGPSEINEVIVAVIDSGIDLDHPDLNVIAGYDFGNDDSDPTDYSSHGTHVSGIIGAKRNSGADNVVGIAPNVKLMPVKVFSDAGGGTTANLALGIRYAVDNGADVINMSLSFSSSDEVVLSAINYAETNNVVVVAASSNESNNWIQGEKYDEDGTNDNLEIYRGFSVVRYPAAYSTVLAVGSVIYDSVESIGISDFSNISDPANNKFVDVVAPGSNISSSSNTSISNPNIKSGTSMASPHVAGLVALIRGKYPLLIPSQVRELIRTTAYDPGIEIPVSYDRTNTIGSGLVNTFNAINYLGLETLVLSGTGTIIGFDFSKEVTDYNIVVYDDMNQITLNATTLSNSSLTINTVSKVSVTDEVVTLNEGDNVITITSSLYGYTETYTLNIYKTAKLDLSKLESSFKNQANGSVSAYSDYVFYANTIDYTSNVPYSASKIILNIGREYYIDASPMSIVSIKFNEEDYALYGVDNVDIEKNLNVGSNTVLVKVEVGVISKIYSLTVNRARGDEVSSLTLKNGEVDLVNFDPDTLAYTADVKNNVDNISFSAVKADIAEGALLISYESTVDESYESGTDKTVALAVGVNNITFKSTGPAIDSLQTIYTFEITKSSLSSDATLSDLTISGNSISPAFSSGSKVYTLEVDHTVASINVSATANHAASDVKINEVSIGNTGNKDIALNTGLNTITVLVTSEDSSEETYTINVTKSAPPLSTDKALSSLVINGYTLSPSFSADTKSYTLAVDYTVSSVNVSATANDTAANVTINTVSLSSYTGNNNITLNTGINTVTVLVTAEDNSEETYIITVTKAAAPVVATPPSGGSSPPPSGGSVPPPIVAPIVVAPIVTIPVEDEEEVVKNVDGTETVIVKVSEKRITDELLDDKVISIQIVANNKKTSQTNVTLSSEILNALMGSKKEVEIVFDKATFKINDEILKSLGIKNSLNISYNAVTSKVELDEILGSDSTKIVSELYELDIFDGVNELTKINTPIPIVLSYDLTKIKNKENLAIYYYDELVKEWVYVGGKLTENGKIRFEARHFSKYAIRENSKTFDDIKNHWAKKEIEILASRGITSGISESLFAPEKTITNAEFIVLLTKVLGLPDSDAYIPYKNIPEDSWYTPYIRSAFSAGIIQSTYGVFMDPLADITREEMAEVLMSSYFYYSKVDPEELLIMAVQFANDEDSVSRMYRDHVRSAYQLQLIVGDNNNNFNPKQNAKRAEAAIVIKKLLVALDLL